MSEQHNAQDWLMSGGVPWAKFDDYGDQVTGTITEEPRVRQSRDYDSNEPAFWPDGGPVTELVITLQTTERDPAVEDDDGKRLFVVNSQAKKGALREAVRQAQAKGLAAGGRLQVTYTHDAEPTKRGKRGAKQYQARYAPPPPRQVPVGDDDRRPPVTRREEPYDPRPARSAAWPVGEEQPRRGEPFSGEQPGRPAPPADDPWDVPAPQRDRQPAWQATPPAGGQAPWEEPALPVPGYDEPPF
jgi:hypothetical protein